MNRVEFTFTAAATGKAHSIGAQTISGTIVDSTGGATSDKVFVAGDVVGAGDTFLAALTYGYMNYNDMEKAIHIANKAAAVAVSHPGTYVLTEEDVKQL